MSETDNQRTHTLKNSNNSKFDQITLSEFGKSNMEHKGPVPIEYKKYLGYSLLYSVHLPEWNLYGESNNTNRENSLLKVNHTCNNSSDLSNTNKNSAKELKSLPLMKKDKISPILNVSDFFS